MSGFEDNPFVESYDIIPFQVIRFYYFFYTRLDTKLALTFLQVLLQSNTGNVLGVSGFVA